MEKNLQRRELIGKHMVYPVTVEILQEQCQYHSIPKLVEIHIDSPNRGHVSSSDSAAAFGAGDIYRTLVPQWCLGENKKTIYIYTYRITPKMGNQWQFEWEKSIQSQRNKTRNSGNPKPQKNTSKKHQNTSSRAPNTF